ncbi:MAG TPA: hypothetical protein VH722_07605 [Alphaproteobacteria bacterium]|jgi:hypothetical protein|nr:hypothetical protein [Alphaproteobacteria bacterium]
MMRKIAIAAGAAVLVAGGAYYGVFVLPDNQFRSGLDQALAGLPQGYTGHYGGAHYSLLTHVATVTDLSIQGSGPSALSETIAKVVVDNPALDFADRWNRAQANPSALKPDDVLPVADRIEVDGVKSTGGGTTGTIASASLTKMRIYPWALTRPGMPALKDIGQVIAASMQAQQKIAAQQQAILAQAQKQQAGDGGDDAQESPVTAPSPADIAALQKESLDALLPVLRIESALFLAMGYDSFDGAALDVTASLPAVAGAPLSSFHVTMAKLHAGAIDRAVGGANTIENMVEDLGPQGKISADRSSVGGMKLRDPAMRLLNGDALSMAMLDGASIGPLEFDGMSITVPASGTAHLDKAAMSEMSFDHSFLKSFGFSVSGLKQNIADLDPRLRDELHKFKLKSITANLGLAYQWDADKKTISLHDVAFSIAELGSLDFNADLVNVDPAAGLAGMPGLAKATLRYQDASLINRLLKADADEKLKPAEVRQMREAYAANLLATLGPVASDPKLADSVKAISDFAKMPRNLTIALAPPAPVPLIAVKDVAAQGPQALVDTLGLSITANQQTP